MTAVTAAFRIHRILNSNGGRPSDRSEDQEVLRETLRENRFHDLFGNSEGKGTFGCLFSLLVLAAAVFAGVKLVPLYYSASSFESDVKTEVSRAGVNFFSDETILKDIVQLAQKNEIRISHDQIKLERLAGQVRVAIAWSEPVDFVFFQYDVPFRVNASSYMGRL